MNDTSYAIGDRSWEPLPLQGERYACSTQLGIAITLPQYKLVIHSSDMRTLVMVEDKQVVYADDLTLDDAKLCIKMLLRSAGGIE